MEGRISREDLKNSGVRPPAADYQASTRRSSYTGRSSGGTRRSYGRRSHSIKKPAIPEGADLFVVQLLASGMLLLIVLFAAIVETDATSAIAVQLNEAFSKNTTLSELKDNALSIGDKLTGGAGTVVEIFGGETAQNDDADGVAETPVAPSEEPAQNVQNVQEDGVTIDSETLKEIYENVGDYPKN